jgi:tyrosyl-tRNA synthetase
MLAKDTVARRLETGISFAEFSYMILQAVDFLHLYEHYGCTIQIGGSDQWGNLVSGLDLIRKVKGPDTKVEVMTSHLLTNCAGEKFGKSLDGALFLDPKKFSPYKLYQYFINVGDDDAEKYLKVFTFLSKEMIEDIVSKHKEAPHNRLAQTRLAEEILTIVHNKEALKHAQTMSSALFSGNVKDLSAADIEDLFSHALVKVAANQKLEDVVIAVKAASSKREAREFIRGNSISVNGERYTDPELIVNQDYLLHHKYLIIRRGKKKYFVAEVK